jgi:hypothetical protein
MEKIVVEKRDLLEHIWVRVEIDSSTDGVYTLHESSGNIVPLDEAFRLAHQYWYDFFDDDPNESMAMFRRFPYEIAPLLAAGRTVADACTQVVLDMHGDLHGLDVSHEENDFVYLNVDSFTWTYNYSLHTCDEIVALMTSDDLDDVVTSLIATVRQGKAKWDEALQVINDCREEHGTEHIIMVTN